MTIYVVVHILIAIVHFVSAVLGSRDRPLRRPTVGDEIGGKVFKSEQKQNKAKLSDRSYSMPPRSRSVVINSLICRKSEITSS